MAACRGGGAWHGGRQGKSLAPGKGRKYALAAGIERGGMAWWQGFGKGVARVGGVMSHDCVDLESGTAES